MFKKLSFLLLTSLLFCTLWGCASKSFEPKNPPSKKNALSAYQPMSAYPGYFNSLTINGNINVIVTVDPKLRQVIATSPEGKTFESSVYYQNIRRHLEIARGDTDSKLSPPCVFIKTPSLNRLDVHNAGQVLVLNLKSPHFILRADNHSFVRLCGEVTRLDATLLDHSRLDAKSLNTETIFLNSSGVSQAEVRNVGGLSTLTGDVSDVYYYTDPKLTATYERDNGSVMRMKGIYPEPPPAPKPKEVSGLG